MAEKILRAALAEIDVIEQSLSPGQCPRLAQQSPETPAGLDLFGRERVADHGPSLRLVFSYRKGYVGMIIPTYDV